MFGIGLAAIGSFFEEISISIGKAKIRDGQESQYTMVFLSLFWGIIWFLGLIIIKGHFVFSLASLPTFTARVVFEIFQAHVSILAIVKSDRSTFGFIRIGTIPLLLIVDLFLGYSVSGIQIFGIGLVVLSLVLLFLNHGIKAKGVGWVILSTIGAVVTISLYKYDITHYNSVEAEQFLVLLILAIYFFIITKIFAAENPVKFLYHRIFFIQSFTQGLESVFLSFAYLFGPASIITAFKRSSSVFWSVISGNVYFHEKHIFHKLVAFGLLFVGILLMVI